MIQSEFYRDYIQSRQWRKVANEAKERAGYKCQLCGDSGKRLETHHNTHERLGHEKPTDLIVLCRDCHSSTIGGRSNSVSVAILKSLTLTNTSLPPAFFAVCNAVSNAAQSEFTVSVTLFTTRREESPYGGLPSLTAKTLSYPIGGLFKFFHYLRLRFTHRVI